MIIAEALGLPETEAKSRVNGDAQDYLEESSLGLQGELELTGFTN